MTSDLLKKLYEFNFKVPVYRMGEAPADLIASDHGWAGEKQRRMLQCIYTIAFLCLLRFDEVLKIQAHQLEVIDEVKGEIKLTLPFRKTHKFGGELFMLHCRF